MSHSERRQCSSPALVDLDDGPLVYLCVDASASPLGHVAGPSRPVDENTLAPSSSSTARDAGPVVEGLLGPPVGPPLWRTSVCPPVGPLRGPSVGPPPLGRRSVVVVGPPARGIPSPAASTAVAAVSPENGKKLA